MTVPTDSTTRQIDFVAEPAEPDGPPVLVGHAAVFNQRTRIDSWEGTFDEEIDPKAFNRTLKARTPLLQYDHGAHPTIGSIPIGRFNVVQPDETGLWVEAGLFTNSATQPLIDAIRGGAITGMSFRFRVVRESLTEPVDANGVPLRRILEVELFELGPVAFPAYAGTSATLRALNQAERDALAGLSYRTRQELAGALPALHKFLGAPPATEIAEPTVARLGDAERGKLRQSLDDWRKGAPIVE